MRLTDIHDYDLYFEDLCLCEGAVGKIEFLEQFRIVGAQVPPSGKETGVKITLWQMVCTYMVPHQKVIPTSGECTRFVMFLPFEIQPSKYQRELEV
ncbi:hypothetical protein TNCV_2579011 [Trichonephila clavipes]|nr:hypothetical protein TNCV_2579011 [Trichonephila clavipes]